MDKYGLIGFPLGHSFSKDYFNNKFNSERIDAQYINFEIPNIEEIKAIILTNPELKGLNVTIPYKQQVIPYLHDITKEAKEIGAVNVIKITRKGSKVHLKGYNSDVVGFVESIRPLLERYHKNALILGTGGASKAVDYGLRSLGVQTMFVSRTKKAGAFTYKELSYEMMEDYKVVVNCTPLGMYPNVNECPDIPYEAVGNHHILYDLIYNPNETLFLANGRKRGAVTKNGLEMLLLQAFASWEFWNE